MSWSYSGDPTSSSVDAVRFLIGDTDFDDQQLSDEEIQFLLSQANGSAYLAAASAAEAIAAKYARLCSKSVGDLSYNYAQRQQHYERLARRLYIKAAEVAMPVAGGISQSDKRIVEQDADRVQPSFTVSLHDNPRLT
jgi:hypothetical protein